ncbi:pro-sigmaK processing inhibitor BofA family protein [Halalkalibacterium ligniniphilum]|uniref:pro-sigmaK processing inhibitor BofA family protein n=1 Tax=Halalkalibacterium ligniniphilum TaxID=1134413 RepID=UPI00034971B5|nr:pro-sigmaK processing inhibitor BofA family protein [Halalkalibacterium ligniniphilum]
MDPIVVFTLLGGLVLMLLIVGAPLKPLRFIGQAAMKVLIGVLLLFFLNTFGSLIGLHIPINGVTATVSGFLGIPGLVLLVAVQQFIL